MQNREVINNTVEDENWNGVWYGCRICKGNTELKDRWRNMTWSSKLKLTAHVEKFHGNEWVEKEHFAYCKKD